MREQEKESSDTVVEYKRKEAALPTIFTFPNNRGRCEQACTVSSHYFLLHQLESDLTNGITRKG